MSLNRYLVIKDKYCVVYAGPQDEYTLQLLYFRKAIEFHFPGLRFYVAGKQHLNPDLSIAEFNPEDFGFVHHLKCNIRTHPVQDFLGTIPLPRTTILSPQGNRCYIAATGIQPTKSLMGNQFEKCLTMVRNQGYEPCDNPAEASWVVGVEGPDLFRAARDGMRTTLIPTGLGTRFYQSMFPAMKVLRVDSKV